jgi:hypothetical protein
MTRAVITGSFAEKNIDQTQCAVRKTKEHENANANIFALLTAISLLIVCPLELFFKASFSQIIKKKFSGP